MAQSQHQPPLPSVRYARQKRVQLPLSQTRILDRQFQPHFLCQRRVSVFHADIRVNGIASRQNQRVDGMIDYIVDGIERRQFRNDLFFGQLHGFDGVNQRKANTCQRRRNKRRDTVFFGIRMNRRLLNRNF